MKHQRNVRNSQKRTEVDGMVGGNKAGEWTFVATGNDASRVLWKKSRGKTW